MMAKSSIASRLVIDVEGNVQNVHGWVVKIITGWVVVCHSCNLGQIVKVRLIRVPKGVTILIVGL